MPLLDAPALLFAKCRACTQRQSARPQRAGAACADSRCCYRGCLAGNPLARQQAGAPVCSHLSVRDSSVVSAAAVVLGYPHALKHQACVRRMHVNAAVSVFVSLYLYLCRCRCLSLCTASSFGGRWLELGTALRTTARSSQRLPRSRARPSNRSAFFVDPLLVAQLRHEKRYVVAILDAWFVFVCLFVCLFVCASYSWPRRRWRMPVIVGRWVFVCAGCRKETAATTRQLVGEQ
jgi:hypothetical protein